MINQSLLHRALYIFTGFLLISFGACQSKSISSDKLNVVVSIAPLESIVAQLGGDRIQVKRILNPSTTSHSFDPTPADAAQVANADIVFFMGWGEEETWGDRLIEATHQPNRLAVMVNQAMDPIGSPPNPHTWISPKRGEDLVTEVEAALKTADPSNADLYKKNALQLKHEINETLLDYEKIINTFSDRRFISVWPTFVYLEKDFGLECVETLIPVHGHNPSPKDLTGIIQRIKKEKIPVLMTIAQGPDNFVKTIADETGIHVVKIDMLGLKGESYISLLQKNLMELKNGFNRPS